MNLISLYSTGDRFDSALRVLYRILKERPIKHGISHRKMPTYAQHHAFAMGKPFRYWYLIELEGKFIGSIECLPTNEFGVHVLKRYQGNGYGSTALDLFLSTHEPLPAIPAVRNGRWLANVAPANKRGKAFFSKNGFRTIQETMAL